VRLSDTTFPPRFPPPDGSNPCHFRVAQSSKCGLLVFPLSPLRRVYFFHPFPEPVPTANVFTFLFSSFLLPPPYAFTNPFLHEVRWRLLQVLGPDLSFLLLFFFRRSFLLDSQRPLRAPFEIGWACVMHYSLPEMTPQTSPRVSFSRSVFLAFLITSALRTPHRPPLCLSSAEFFILAAAGTIVRQRRFLSISRSPPWGTT